MTEQIEIRDLSKSFSVDGQRLEVLKELNLSVPAREITVILGAAAAGKRPFCG